MTTRSSVLMMVGLALGVIASPDRAGAADVTVVVGAAPRLVVVLDTGIRYCEECDEDVFFYGGFWYVYRIGGWYQCTAWGRPWVRVRQGRLPAVFLKVPPGRFRHRYGSYHPAHEHHPKLDTWGRKGAPRDRPRNADRRVESGDPGRGSELGKADGQDQEKAKGKGKSKGKGKGKGKKGGNSRH